MKLIGSLRGLTLIRCSVFTGVGNRMLVSAHAGYQRLVVLLSSLAQQTTRNTRVSQRYGHALGKRLAYTSATASEGWLALALFSMPLST